MKRLRHWLLDTPLRHIAGPAYRGVVTAELTAERILDSVLRPPPHDENVALLNRLTAVIKTFERPDALRRLVHSIRTMYPDLSILVVDDSADPHPLEGVDTVILPFDSGVSAGRQAALDRVRTEYMLTLDDDFVFYRHTRLPDALAVMQANPSIDIMGGMKVDLPFHRVADYASASLYPTEARSVVPAGTKIAELPVYDKVSSFFLARTERLRLVGWDPQIKRLDHADFFTRAKGILVSVYNRHMRCLHAPTLFKEPYMRYRNDVEGDRQRLKQRYFAEPLPARRDGERAARD